MFEIMSHLDMYYKESDIYILGPPDYNNIMANQKVDRMHRKTPLKRMVEGTFLHRKGAIV